MSIFSKWFNREPEQNKEPTEELTHGVFWDGVWHKCDIEFHSELIKYKSAQECIDALGGKHFYIQRYGNGTVPEIDLSENQFILATVWNNGDIRMYKDYIKSPVIELCKYVRDMRNKYEFDTDEYNSGKYFTIEGVVVKFLSRGYVSVDGAYPFNSNEVDLLMKAFDERCSKEISIELSAKRRKLSDALGVKS